jgi:putative tryptophan/tyrosine transport system substrate-binding protein
MEVGDLAISGEVAQDRRLAEDRRCAWPSHGGSGMMIMRAALIVALVFGILTSPLASEAQQTTKVWRIGYLGYAYPREATDLEAFRQRLRDLGYVEGKNLVIEARGAESSVEWLPALAAELVSLKLDVIAARGNQTIVALKRATQTIPIVMISASDPVGTGLVSSLAHPGGNVTGLSSLAQGPSAKGLELLTQTVPGMARVGVLMAPNAPTHPTYLREIRTAGQRTGIAVLGVEARGRDEIERAFAELAKARAQGLIVLPSPVTVTHQMQIVKLAGKHRLPAMYPWLEFTESGGLMAYSANRTEMFRRSATFVDKILKGAKPADLPIEQPTQFELVINMKTAKTLGLTIPPAVLLRADRVIE